MAVTAAHAAFSTARAQNQTESQDRPVRASEKVVFLPDLPSTRARPPRCSPFKNTPPIHSFFLGTTVLFTNLTAHRTHIIHRKKTPQERGGKAGVETLSVQPTINLILHITNRAQLGGVIRNCSCRIICAYYLSQDDIKLMKDWACESITVNNFFPSFLQHTTT